MNLCVKALWSGPNLLNLISQTGSWSKATEASSKHTNEQGEPTISYRWTGWVWEITSWSSRLQENYPRFRGMLTDYAQKTPQTLRHTSTNNWYRNSKGDKLQLWLQLPIDMFHWINDRCWYVATNTRLISYKKRISTLTTMLWVLTTEVNTFGI